MSAMSAGRPSALVVYESMYGNTRAVAEAIAQGLSVRMQVAVVSVAQVDPEQLAAAELVVAGAPVHGLSLSRPSTRKAAADAAGKPGSDLTMQPDWDLPGMREWLAGAVAATGRFAAFDTRMRAPLGLSGSATRGITRGLRRAGLKSCARAESFRVTRHNRLVDGELDRARQWGLMLANGTGLPRSRALDVTSAED